MTSSRSAVLSLGLSALIVYLAANSVTGRQGLISYMDMQARERSLSAEYAALTAEKAALDARVHRLSRERLDLDVLEERARVTYDAAHPDELIFDLTQSGRAETP